MAQAVSLIRAAAAKDKIAIRYAIDRLLWVVLLLLLGGVARGAPGNPPASAQVPPRGMVNIRLSGGRIELVFLNGVGPDARVDLTTADGTYSQNIAPRDSGLSVVALGGSEGSVKKALLAGKGITIRLSGASVRAEWRIEPLPSFDGKEGLPRQSTPASDSPSSSGTLAATERSARADLSFSGSGNNYVQFPFTLPIPPDTIGVGGLFGSDSANTVPVTFAVRLSDSRGEIFGYFLPGSRTEEEVPFKSLTAFNYRFNAPPAEGAAPPPAPVLPLKLSALLLEAQDHKYAGPARATVDALFVIRQARYESDPETSVLRPSLVTVDFSRRVANVTSMSGFLHGIDTVHPQDSEVIPLRPALWRMGSHWRSERDRVRQWKIPAIMIVSDVWGYGSAKPPYEDYESWEARVRQIAREGKDFNLIWDIWNEPDVATFWKGTREQFFETFARGANAVRAELGPGAMVTGPSLARYDRAYITQFLDYCKARGVRLDVLSWHELAVDGNIPVMTDHLREARHLFLDNPDYKSLGIQKIQINEIIGPSAQYRPGEILAYFHALEAGGADGACRACWNDSTGASNCWNSTLDGILTSDTKAPRAAWWAYRVYSDSVSHRVQSESPDMRIASFASRQTNPAAGAQVLIGYFAYENLSPPSADVRLLLKNVPALSTVSKAKRVHVKIERIPDTGEQPVSQLTVVREENAPVMQGSVEIILRELKLHEAYVVTVSDPQ